MIFRRRITFQTPRVFIRARAFFNYITTGAYTPVGPLLAPVVKHDFQMSWALLIISKKSTLLKELYLPVNVFHDFRSEIYIRLFVYDLTSKHVHNK